MPNPSGVWALRKDGALIGASAYASRTAFNDAACAWKKGDPQYFALYEAQECHEQGLPLPEGYTLALESRAVAAPGVAPVLIRLAGDRHRLLTKSAKEYRRRARAYDPGEARDSVIKQAQDCEDEMREIEAALSAGRV